MDEEHIPTAAEAVGRSIASAWIGLAAVFAAIGLALGVMVVVMASGMNEPRTSFGDFLVELGWIISGFAAVSLVVLVLVFNRTRRR